MKKNIQDLETFKFLLQSIANANGMVVLDFDGVIADTEPLHRLAYEELLKEAISNNKSFEFERYMGRSEEQIYELINSDLGTSLDVKTDKPKRLGIFWELVKKYNLQPSYFVRPLIEATGSIEILSSQDIELIRQLTDLWEITRNCNVLEWRSKYETKFDVIPKLAEIYDQRPETVFHFEDSADAIRLSKQAGHQTIFVSHQLNSKSKVDAGWRIDIK